MADYLISIIRPSGYVHSSCFQEVAETLQFALKALGHRAAIIENIVDRQATNIILGAHLLSEAEMKTLPEGTVIYNLEQLGASHLSEAYRRLAERHTIWDYSPVNLERWKEAGCLYPPRLVEIGYVPELRRIVSQTEQDIDVLFYGSVNEHRRKILLQLEQAGINVHCAFGVYGRERDALIARAKVVLNLHYYETNLFEIVRVSYLLANSKAVVSEPSPDMGTYADAVAVFPAEKIVAGCLELVRDERRRRELEQRGFEYFSKRSAVRILAEVLPQPANHEQSLQELYLDMVQRCLINVIYEDPNQDRWSPHEYRSELRAAGPGLAIAGAQHDRQCEDDESATHRGVCAGTEDSGRFYRDGCVAGRSLHHDAGGAEGLWSDGSEGVGGGLLLRASEAESGRGCGLRGHAPYVFGACDLAGAGAGELHEVWAAGRSGRVP